MMDEKKFKQALRLLRSLHDLQNGAPLEKWRDEWEDTMNEIGLFLAEHEQEDPGAFMDEVRGREPEKIKNNDRR